MFHFLHKAKLAPDNPAFSQLTPNHHQPNYQPTTISQIPVNSWLEDSFWPQHMGQFGGRILLIRSSFDSPDLSAKGIMETRSSSIA